jgi:hypothetical protein
MAWSYFVLWRYHMMKRLSFFSLENELSVITYTFGLAFYLSDSGPSHQ